MDRKYREVQHEIKKKQKDQGEDFVGLAYVDAYRNISVAATGEADLSKDLDDKES